MFSSMIQNLLSTSGQSNAMQRAVQMNNHVNNINSQFIPIDKESSIASVNKKESFENVLKTSSKVKFGDLLTNPSTQVQAKIYSNTAIGNTLKSEYTTKNKYQECRKSMVLMKN